MPKFLRYVLKIMINRSVYESAIIDFEDYYAELRTGKGTIYALLWITGQLASLIPSFTVDSLYRNTIMFKNYFKTAIRSIRRNKVYSTLNSTGLILGITSSLLILMYVKFELSYDAYHKNSENITRVLMNGVYVSPPALAEDLKNNYPEIVEAARLFHLGPAVQYGDKNFQENGFYLVDQEYLDIFSYPIISGNRIDPLAQPFTVVMTKSSAAKYFGRINPVGKQIIINRNGTKYNFTVTGIIDDIPQNSHFHFDFLGSIGSLKTIRGDKYLSGFGNFPFKTFLLMDKNANREMLHSKLRTDYPERFTSEMFTNMELQPLREIHLSGNKVNEIEGNSDIKNIYILASIALFILLIVAFNYINLTTALYINRAKELNIRKIVGAKKKNLIWQSITESMIFTVVSTVASLFIIKISIPAVNSIFGTALNYSASDWSVNVLIFSVIITLTVVSAIYPAIFMSSFDPVKSLKSGTNVKHGLNALLRKSLIVTQFGISIVLVICSSVIYQQMNFAKNRSLGYDQENVMTIVMGGTEIKKNSNLFIDELKKLSGVTNATVSSGSLTEVGWIPNIKWDGRTKDTERFMFFKLAVDYNFLSTYDISIKSGRGFSEEYETDRTEAVLINEAAAKKIGWEDPIGRSIDGGKVIGIISNLHFESMYSAISPLLIRINNRDGFKSYTSVKLSSMDINNSIKDIETVWKKFAGDYPFHHQFVDESLNTMYKNERKLSEAIKYLSGLAIFIACLGLYGLALYACKNRVKEIGIRKVLGSTSPKVAILLSMDILKLVILANVIAFPIAYYFAVNWLQKFAYKIDLNIELFVASGLAAVALALITISFQTIRYANKNPIDSIRYE